MQERTATDVSELLDILRGITYEPCFLLTIDGWNIDPFENEDSAGFVVRLRFERVDRETGRIGIGLGGHRLIPRGATESAVVKTVLSALLAIAEHEIREGLLYRGRRPFDPHRTVAEMVGEQTL